MAEKYGAYCHTVARNVLGNDADAEGVRQRRLPGGVERHPRAQPQNLLAYLAKTTRNIALRRLEHDQAQKRDSRLHLLLDELAEVLPGGGVRGGRGRPGGTGGGHQHLPQGEGHPGRAALFLRRYFWGDSIRDLAQAFRYSGAR